MMLTFYSVNGTFFVCCMVWTYMDSRCTCHWMLEKCVYDFFSVKFELSWVSEQKYQISDNLGVLRHQKYHHWCTDSLVNKNQNYLICTSQNIFKISSNKIFKNILKFHLQMFLSKILWNFFPGKVFCIKKIKFNPFHHCFHYKNLRNFFFFNF